MAAYDTVNVWTAASDGDLETVRRCIESGAHAPHTPDAQGYTCLHAAASYGHQPEAWMVGETCWPDFQQRVRIKYNWLLGWCAARSIDQATDTAGAKCSRMSCSQRSSS